MGWLDNILSGLGLQNTAGMAQGGSQALRAGAAYNYAPPQAVSQPMPAAPPPQTAAQAAPSSLPPMMEQGPYRPYFGAGGAPPMPQQPPARTWLDDFRGMSPEQIDAGLSQMQQQAAATGKPHFDSVVNGMQMRYGLQENEAARALQGLMNYRNGGQLTPTQVAQGFVKFEDGNIGAGYRPYPRQYRAPKDDPNWQPLTPEQEAQGYFMYEDGAVDRRPEFYFNTTQNKNGGTNWGVVLEQYNQMQKFLKNLGLIQ